MIWKLKRALRGPYYFLSLRLKAWRLRFKEWRRKNDRDGSLPIPPPLLRYRVHGGLDRESYLQAGRTCAQNINDLLGTIGKDLYSFEHVLDFGCGSGRVLRFFAGRPESCHLYGSDIDRQAIAWCRKHLPFARWSANDALPPTRYADAAFDLIYAISVFTHLDEKMQFAWLDELRRITKPGGILILTVHGEGARAGSSPEKQALVSEKGFLFEVAQTGRFKLDGLPDFYQVSQHSRAYVEERWSALFEIIGYAERGINGHQDAVILRKR